jgi:hypothetical protein
MWRLGRLGTVHRARMSRELQPGTPNALYENTLTSERPAAEQRRKRTFRQNLRQHAASHVGCNPHSRHCKASPPVRSSCNVRHVPGRRTFAAFKSTSKANR